MRAVHDLKMELYWRLPVRLQEIALSLYARKLDGLYYGLGYAEVEADLLERRAWSSAEIAEWQNQNLRKVILECLSRVPFYRSYWMAHEPREVSAVDELSRLPLLDKQSVRQSERSLVRDDLQLGELSSDRTSGTTGTSLTVYWDRNSLQRWWAIHEVACRNVAGVNRFLPRAMIGGRPIIEGRTSKAPFWRFNQHWNQLYLSAYHISRRNTPEYIEAIRRYGSEWITGYGSAIAALAEWALELDLEPIQLRAAIVSGDTLLPRMRKCIETFFQCKCHDHYGQSEGVCTAMECLEGRMHVVPYAGIVEVIDDQGQRCGPGQVGEIVATGLANRAFPLVRYRTGDLAAVSKDQDCPCSSPFLVIEKLEGRTDDYLVTADGRRIGRLSTAMKRSPAIHSAQIVQDSAHHAFLLVRPSAGYRPEHGVAVRDDLIERIGDMTFEICEVKAIPRTPSGKVVLVRRLDDQTSIEAFRSELSKILIR